MRDSIWPVRSPRVTARYWPPSLRLRNCLDVDGEKSDDCLIFELGYVRDVNFFHFALLIRRAGGRGARDCRLAGGGCSLRSGLGLPR